MAIRNLQASNIGELRNIVNKVPTTLRDLARAERRELIKMEAIQPNSASYVISRGGLHNNVELAKCISELRAKNAQTFYQRSPIGNMPSNNSTVNVVKAGSIL